MLNVSQARGWVPKPNGKVAVKRGWQLPEQVGAVGAGDDGYQKADDWQRYYHGTGYVYDKPDPAKDEGKNLFGPGHYGTSDPRVAGGIVAPEDGPPPTQWAPPAPPEWAVAPQRKRGDIISKGYALGGYVQGQSELEFYDNQLAALRDEMETYRSILSSPPKSWAPYGVDDEGVPYTKQDVAEVKALLADVEDRHHSLSLDRDITLNTLAKPNVRPFDAPPNLNLLDADAPLSQQQIDHLQQVTGEDWWARDTVLGLQPGMTGNDLYQELRHGAEGEKDAVNAYLALAGYDGIKYAGGKRIPLQDERGKRIEHNAIAIFPESYDKIKNGINGQIGGSSDVPDMPTDTARPGWTPKLPGNTGAPGWAPRLGPAINTGMPQLDTDTGNPGFAPKLRDDTATPPPVSPQLPDTTADMGAGDAGYTRNDFSSPANVTPPEPPTGYTAPAAPSTSQPASTPPGGQPTLPGRGAPDTVRAGNTPGGAGVPSPQASSQPWSGGELTPNQFGDPSLTSAEAYAACGPAAAVAFARRYGRNPTLREALTLAQRRGWTAGGGMAGPDSEVSLMQDMGVQAHQGPANDWYIQQSVAAGDPVSISTPNHYFVIDGYDPQSGLYHVGNSGKAFIAGSQWMSLDGMKQLGGGIQTAIYADHPLGSSDPYAEGHPLSTAPPATQDNQWAADPTQTNQPVRQPAPQSPRSDSGQRAASAVGAVPKAPIEWFSYADQGREILKVTYADGSVVYQQVGDAGDQSDGTVMSTGTLGTNTHENQFGAGADFGDDYSQAPDVPDELGTYVSDHLTTGSSRDDWNQLRRGAMAQTGQAVSTALDAQQAAQRQDVQQEILNKVPQPDSFNKPALPVSDLTRNDAQAADNVPEIAQLTSDRPPPGETSRPSPKLPQGGLHILSPEERAAVTTPTSAPGSETPLGKATANMSDRLPQLGPDSAIMRQASGQATNPQDIDTEIGKNLSKTVVPDEVAHKGVDIGPAHITVGDVAGELLKPSNLAGAFTSKTTSAGGKLLKSTLEGGLEGELIGQVAGKVAAPVARAVVGGGKVLAAPVARATQDAVKQAYDNLHPVMRAAVQPVAAKALPSMALRNAGVAAGGALGGLYEATHDDPHDPDYWSHISAGIAAGATVTAAGLGGAALIDKTVSPWLVAGMHELLKPSRSLLAPSFNTAKSVQDLLATHSGALLGAYQYADIFKRDAEAAFGKPGELFNTLRHAQLWETAGHMGPVTPEQQAVLDKYLVKEVNDTGAVGRKHGYIDSDVRKRYGVANYLPHLYESTLKKAQQLGDKLNVSPRDFFSFEREHPTLADAVKKGLKPVNNWTEGYAHYFHKVKVSEARYQLIQGLKTVDPNSVMIFGSTGKPLRKTPAHIQDLLDNHNWQLGSRIAPHEPALANVAFSPELSTIVHNLVDPSVFRQNARVATTMDTVASIKAGMLGASAFHETNLWRQAVNASGWRSGTSHFMTGVWNGVNPGAYNTFVRQNAEWFMRFANAGGVTAREAVSEKTLPGVTGLLDPKTRGRAALGVGARFTGGALPGGVGAYMTDKAGGSSDEDAIHAAVLTGLGTGTYGALASKPIAEAMWKRGVPTLKVLTFMTLSHPTNPAEDRLVAEYVNQLFGGMNLTAIARSQSVQDALRFATLAPDWQEGWARQIGSFFRGDALGSLNRGYWARTAVNGAFILEGLNYALSSIPDKDGKSHPHFSNENGPGHALTLETSALSDRMGWNRTDPNTGEKYRTYLDVLGPLRGMLEPPVESVRAWSGDPAADPGKKWGSFVSGRMGIVPGIATTLGENTDFRGRPTIPDGTPTWKAWAIKAGQILQKVAPVGPADFQRTAQRDPLPVAIAGFVGLRSSHLSPLQEKLNAQEAIIRNYAKNPQAIFDEKEHRAGLLAVNDAQQREVYTGQWKSNGVAPTHYQIDQQLHRLQTQRPTLPTDNAADYPQEMFDSPEKHKQLLDDLRKLRIGVEGSTSPADIHDDGTLNDAIHAYWNEPDPKNRARLLVQHAERMGVDSLALLDAIKANAMGRTVTPVNATSKDVSDWVTLWAAPEGVQSDQNGIPDPIDLAQKRRDVIEQIAQERTAAGHPVSADAVWDRIRTRMMPTSKDPPTALQKSRDAALDTMYQVHDPRKFAKYMDPATGKPVGTPEKWKQWDDQIASAKTKSEKKDPAIKALIEARDAGTQAQRMAIYKSPHHEDYERWFGIGRNMTEAEWQTYQNGTVQRYKDTKDPVEARRRDRIIELYKALSPKERANQTVFMVVNGRETEVHISVAVKQHLHYTLDKDWRGKLGLTAEDDPTQDTSTP